MKRIATLLLMTLPLCAQEYKIAIIGMVHSHVWGHFQSMLDRGHSVPVWSEDEDPMVPVRERYADMAAQLGATVWLTGPSAQFGEEWRFSARGISLESYEHRGPNPSALELLRGRERQAA